MSPAEKSVERYNARRKKIVEELRDEFEMDTTIIPTSWLENDEIKSILKSISAWELVKPNEVPHE